MKLKILILLTVAAAPLHAQSGVRPPQGWSLAAFGGGAAFTDFHRDFGRRIGPETSGAIAGTLAYWPSNHWGVRVRAAHVPSRFETFMADQDSTELQAALGITTYEGQLMFRLPTIRGRIMPYGLIGGGVVRYGVGDDRPMPTEAEATFGAGTKGIASGGIGAAIAFRPRGWYLHFELTDQVSRTPMPSSASEGIRTTSSVAFMVGASWNFLR